MDQQLNTIIATINMAQLPHMTEAQLITIDSPVIRLYVHGKPVEFLSRSRPTDESMANFILGIRNFQAPILTETKLVEESTNKGLLVLNSKNEDILLSFRHYCVILGQEAQCRLKEGGQQGMFYYLKGGKQQIRYNNTEYNFNAINEWHEMVKRGILVSLQNSQEIKYVLHDTKSNPALIIIQHKEQEQRELYNLIEQECRNRQIKCGLLTRSMSTIDQALQFMMIREINRVQLIMIKDDMKSIYRMQEIAIVNDQNKEDIRKKINDYIEGVLEGKIQKYLDREPKDIDLDIKILDQSNFTQSLSKNEYVLMMFHQHRCPIAAEFAKKFKFIHDKYTKILVTHMGYDHAPQLYLKYVQKSPKIVLFIRGKQVYYQQQLTLQKLQEFIGKIFNIRVKNIQNVDQITQPSIIIKGYKDDKELQVLDLIVKEFKVYFMNGQNQIMFVNHNQNIKYKGDIAPNSIRKWALSLSKPSLINLFDPKIAGQYSQAVKTNHMAIIYVSFNKAERKSIQNKLSLICKGKTQFICFYAYNEQPNFSRFLQWLNYNDTKHILIMTKLAQQSYYLYDNNPNDISQESIKLFLHQIQIGKVKKAKLSNDQSNDDTSEQTEQATSSNDGKVNEEL